MVRGIGRFDRRVRPAEDTDVFPAIKDDDNTGQIPVPAAAADAEVTGEIPPVRDVEPADEDADVADLEPQDADAESSAMTGWRSCATRPSVSASMCGSAWCTCPQFWWPGWSVKRGFGCHKQADGYGRG